MADKTPSPTPSSAAAKPLAEPGCPLTRQVFLEPN